MKKLGLGIVLIFGLTGCSAISDKAIEYAESALEKQLDKKLADRGLTVEEIKKAVNPEGKIDSATMAAVIKSVTTDVALMEGKKAVDAKVKELSTDPNNNDNIKNIIVAVLTLVSAYLGKQVVSAKNDGVRDARIMVLEKAVQRDIDGDGVIGETKT